MSRTSTVSLFAQVEAYLRGFSTLSAIPSAFSTLSELDGRLGRWLPLTSLAARACAKKLLASQANFCCSMFEGRCLITGSRLHRAWFPRELLSGWLAGRAWDACGTWLAFNLFAGAPREPPTPFVQLRRAQPRQRE